MSTRLWLGGLLLLICAGGAYAYLKLGKEQLRPAPLAPVGDAPADAAAATKKKSSPPLDPLFQGWEKPAATLLVSGPQHGYFEPCGCSLVQLGGMARRGDLVAQIQKKGWPLTALDVGGLVNPKRKMRKQAKIKFEATTAALKEMKYAGLGLGPEEFGLGSEYLLSQHMPKDLPFLCANVQLFGDFAVGIPLQKTMITVGEVKIGVTAILGDTFKDEILPPGQNEAGDIKFLNPLTALEPVVAELEKEKPDLLVLLSHAKLDESKALAKALPKFDLVISAGGPNEPDGKPIMVGKTMVLCLGEKAKHVGVVGYFPKEKEKLRFELESLDDKRFKNAPAMDDLMRLYQDRLKTENVAATDLPISHPTGFEFVGAAKCGECHTKAYNKWKTAAPSGVYHAHAFASLQHGRKGQEATWIPRVYDAECLACHVTGWNPKEMLRYKSGYIDEQTSPLLTAQQCENCHGPGSQHVALEEPWKKAKGGKVTDEMVAQRKALHLDVEMAKNRVCYDCHDNDNSPNFNFDKYWADVKHPWRD